MSQVALDLDVAFGAGCGLFDGLAHKGMCRFCPVRPYVSGRAIAGRPMPGVGGIARRVGGWCVFARRVGVRLMAMQRLPRAGIVMAAIDNDNATFVFHCVFALNTVITS